MLIFICEKFFKGNVIIRKKELRIYISQEICYNYDRLKGKEV